MIDFCKPEAGRRLIYLHPIALELAAYVMTCCEALGVPCVISDSVSTPAEDVDLARVSSTHREGRAFDVSCRDMSPAAIDALIERAVSRFNVYAATGKEGKKVLAYIHDAGTGKHIHFQIDRRFGCEPRHVFGILK